MAADIFVIHITRKCNLDCTYCYETDKRNYNFSLEEIQAIIDSIAQDLIQAESPRVELLGGEPLLHIEGIRYALEQVYRLNPSVQFLITTNGTIYSQSLVELFNRYNLLLYISLDGNAFMHNTNRAFKHSKKGSFDIVNQNTISYLKSLNKKPCISMTLNKYTIPFLYQGIKHYCNIGAHDVSIGITAQSITEENKQIIINQTKLFYLDKELFYKMNIPMLTKHELSFFVQSECTGTLEHKKVVNSNEASEEFKKAFPKHFFFEEIRKEVREKLQHDQEPN